MTEINDVEVTRGDTLELLIDSIRIGDTGNFYTLQDTDIVFLEVKKFTYNKIPLIHKEVTKADCESDGQIIIEISSLETAKLNIDEYYYDVRILIQREGIMPCICTIVPRSRFTVLQEVTYLSGGDKYCKRY